MPSSEIWRSSRCCPALSESSRNALMRYFALPERAQGGRVYPFELAAEQVAYLVGLGVPGGDALLALLEVVLVVAAVGVDGSVVEFHHDVADPVEEVAVVRDHQQGAAAAFQIALQELNGFDVEVVGGLVHDQEVGVERQHLADGHALHLASREFSHLPVRVRQAEGGQQLPEPLEKCRPSVFVEAGGVAAAVVEHLLEYAESGGEVIVLLEEGYADVLEEHHPPSRVGAVLAREYAQQGGLSGAVGGDQGDLVALVDVEAYMLEKHFRAVGLRDVLYLEIAGHARGLQQAEHLALDSRQSPTEAARRSSRDSIILVSDDTRDSDRRLTAVLMGSSR